MKNLKIKFLFGLIIISPIITFNSCTKGDLETETTDTTIKTLLTEKEVEDLLVLREEEKLARDVYIYAYNKYGIFVHNNISNSEQSHMDRVLEILNYYGINDPAASDIGVFNNPDLQALYNTLTTEVDKSSLDALLVGATIEDLDIYDIDEFIERTDKEDIIVMYENLKFGSRNHMRSFYNMILNNNGTYTPQFISQEYFDEIISTSNESCGSN